MKIKRRRRMHRIPLLGEENDINCIDYDEFDAFFDEDDSKESEQESVYVWFPSKYGIK